MRICPLCHAKFPDVHFFCPEDGELLQVGKEPPATPLPLQVATPPPPPPQVQQAPAVRREPLPPRVLDAHSAIVRDVAFSRDGRILASASNDKTIRLWDVESGQVRRTLEGHGEHVNSVAFSTDGSLLASGSADDTLRLWNTATGQQIYAVNGPPPAQSLRGGVTSVAFSPDGRTVASTWMMRSFRDEGLVRLADADTGRFIWSARCGGMYETSVEFTLDGGLVVSCKSSDSVSLWDAATGRLVRRLSCAVPPFFLAIGPGDLVAAACAKDKLRYIEIWDIAASKRVSTIEGPDGGHKIAFSPNGRVLASGGEDNHVKIWDVETGKLLRTLPGHTDWVLSVAFSPDGSILASGSRDGKVRFWDVAELCV